ncbi:MAG: Ca2+-dependent phosphoinositide-specific phospholipase C [Christensenellales bacterium]|jgi:hypothetical protein
MAAKIAKVVAIVIVAAILCYFISLIIIFNVEVKKDFKAQQERLAGLLAEEREPVNEADFVNFDVQTSELKLNEMQVLATHNSYKTMPNMYISYPLSLIFGQKTRNGWYGMKHLSEQLDQGYRGVELDVTRYDNKFILMHDPVTDWRTNGIDFALALKEIKLWSDANPDHIPLHLMLQVRNAFCPYSLKFQTLKTEELQMMDALIKDTFGDGIITPGSVKGDYDTLQEAVLAGAWPKIKDSLGKVYFTILFDQEKVKQKYIDMDTSFATQQCFFYTKLDEEPNEYSAFILADDPLTEGLDRLIEDGYFIRTRIDEQYDHREERFQAAVNIGANILATDYPLGNLYDDGYECKLTQDFKTVLARGSVVY